MTATLDDIDGVFDDKIPEPVNQEPEEKGVEESEPPADKEKPEDTEGEAKADELEGETKEEKSVPLTVVLEERRKRQLAEDRAAQLEKKYAPQVEESPDPVKDPEGYRAWVKQGLILEELGDRINNSRAEMLGKFIDYEEKEDIFLFISKKNPALIVEMNKNPSPASFAYKKASEYLQEQHDKIAAGILASGKGNQDKRKALAAKAPDLTGAAAIGVNSTKLQTMSDDDDLFADSPFKRSN